MLVLLPVKCDLLFNFFFPVQYILLTCRSNSYNDPTRGYFIGHIFRARGYR